MSEENNLLSLAKTIKLLSSTRDGRINMIKQKNLMSGILTLLNSSNETVVLTVLQAIQTLANSAECGEMIKSNYALKTHCNKLKNDYSSHPLQNKKELMLTCLEVVNLLSLPIQKPADKIMEVSREISSSKNDKDINIGNKRFINNINRRAKQLFIQMDVKDDEHRNVINNILIKYKGIISFTWDKSKERVILRVNPKFKLELLAYKLVQEANVNNVFKICRNITKQEVLVPVDIPRGEVVDLRSAGYFPDDYDGNQEFDGDDVNNNTFISNEEKQLPLATGRESNIDGGSWFSSVGSFLSKKLFW